jgi:HSP20 family molecular chaperone IbpA
MLGVSCKIMLDDSRGSLESGKHSEHARKEAYSTTVVARKLPPLEIYLLVRRLLFYRYYYNNVYSSSSSRKETSAFRPVLQVSKPSAARHAPCFLINQEVRLELTAQMPGTADKQGNIDAAEGVINGRHEQGIAGKEKARQSQGRVLGETNLFRRAVELHETGATNHPL